MSEAAARLRDGLTRLGFGDASVTKSLLAFSEILLAANARTNLVGAHTLDELVDAHFLDSIAPFAARKLAGDLIDVGSGAGLPAIPIALAFPSVQVTMLEPRGKRVEFLAEVIDRLGLRNCTARKSMAETVGRSDLRESAQTVTLRAVAKPATALELAVPLLERGGQALLYVGRQAAPTAHELDVADRLGARLLEAKAVDVPYLQSVRHAWWFRKMKATPDEYPRRAKVPSLQPL